jgi:ADP-heptose:LPS heptosyltransferase
MLRAELIANNAVVVDQDSLTNQPSFKQIQNLAFEQNHIQVFHAWCDFDAHYQQRCLEDKYVGLSICESVAAHLARLLAFEPLQVRVFSEKLSAQISLAGAHIKDQGRSYSLQWFLSLDAVVRAFTDSHMLVPAQQMLILAKQTGAHRFPAAAQSLGISEAYLNLILGNLDQAEAVALKFVNKPYLMPSRADRAQMYMRVLPILAKTGHLKEYKEAMWRGVTSFYSDGALREVFVQKAITLYRGVWRTLARSEVPISGRLIFALQRLTAWSGKFAFLKWLGVNKLMFSVLRTQLYIRNYFSYTRPYNLKRGATLGRAINVFGANRTVRKILVTRAMGGMGDIMMMAPGLIALKKKHPDKEIHFAIPKSFFCLFDGMPEFTCIDIEATEIDVHSYFRWIDLTDCPAARTEGLQFPQIRSNRIAIFAKAMGVNLKRLKRSGILPKYVISNEEQTSAKRYLDEINPHKLPVIGIQPFSAETYRTWPHAEQLVQDLASKAIVLVFNHENTPGFEGVNIHKIIKPVRESFSIVAQCGLLIVPDSSFVHLGPALGIPTVGIFGPTNGRVVAKYSTQYIKLVDPIAKGYSCSPCYRNENKPCAVTGDRESVCLKDISVADVKAAIAQPTHSAWSRFKLRVRDLVW